MSPLHRASLTFSTFAGMALTGVALAGCPHTSATDAGRNVDAREPILTDDAGTPPTPTGVLRVRLAHFVVAGPNLTVCLSTIPGTGVAETTGHILGTPDAARMLDGTLPYPAVSPTIPLPIYDAPGFGYAVRLFNRADVPFVLGGACPTDGSITPVVEGRFAVESLPGHDVTFVALGVPAGAPVRCGTGTCPTPHFVALADDFSTPAAGTARARVVHTIPNLPLPIHVCFDPDYTTAANGPLPATRVLPAMSDTDGLAFGEATTFVTVPPLSGTPGAFFVHLQAPGAPDCFAATAALGPITLPFPVPATAPADVARTIDAGDVLSLFAFGRLGGTCMTNDDCAAIPGGICAPGRNLCVDALSPSVLPWQDVIAGE